MQPEQQQRIMGYFIEEAKDHLNTIEQGLLNLQSTIADPEMVNEVFRAAHSVKGGAAMLGLSSIQKTAHRLEDYFKVLKESPGIKPDQKLETLLLRVFDTLQELLDQLQSPGGLNERSAQAALTQTEPVFAEVEQHLTQLGHQAKAMTNTGSEMQAQGLDSEDIGSNALLLIFQNDVPDQLREMLQIFRQADTLLDARDRLQDICFGLKGLGEAFGLMQWSDLLEMTAQAIANLDNSYRTLAPIVITEIKQAQDLVLRDRASDIAPSEQLQAMVPVQSSLEFDQELADFFAIASQDADATTIALQSTEGIDEFNFDSRDFAFPELHSADMEPANVSDDFELNALFDLPELEEASISAERNFSNAEASQLDPDQGPEVGMAELNSLADLFEGEMPDLVSSWQQEEVLDAESLTPIAGSNDALTAEDANDFSDLLSNEFDSAEINADSDDLASLFGDALLDEFDAIDTAAGVQNSTLEQSSVEFELSDLDSAFTEAQLETDNLDLTSLLDGLDSPALDCDRLDRAEASLIDFEREDSENSLDNLGELFAGLDDADLGFSFSSEPATLPNFEDSLLFESNDFTDIFSEPIDAEGDIEDIALPEANHRIEAQSNLDENAAISAQHDSEAFDDLLLDLSDEGSALNNADSLALNLWSDSDSPLDLSLNGFAANPFEQVSEAAIESFLVQDASEQDELDTLFSSTLFDEPLSIDSEPSINEVLPSAPQANLDSSKALNSIEDFDARLDELSSPDLAVSEAGHTPSLELPDFDLNQVDSELDDLFGNAEEIDLNLDFVADRQTNRYAETEAVDAADLEVDFSDLLSGLTSEPAISEESDFVEIEHTITESDLIALSELVAESASDERIAELSIEQSDLDLFGLETSAADIQNDFNLDFSEELPELSAVSELDLSTSYSADSLEVVDDFADLDLELFGAETSDAALIEISSEPALNLDAVESADNLDAFDALFDDDQAPLASSDANLDLLLSEEGVAALGIASTTAPLHLEEVSNQADYAEPLDDLDALISDPPEATPASEFDSLDLLLDEPANASQFPTEVIDDRFTDLESLLSEPVAGAKTDSEAEAEFGDLEKMLEDTDAMADSSASQAITPAGRRTARPSKGFSEQTMRVPVKHLDNLSNLVGELVVNRNSLEQDQERLRQSLDNLLYQVQQLSDVGQRMQDLYERSLLESSLLASRHNHRVPFGGSDNGNSSTTDVEYDPLEMDRFTGFHSLSQEMIELIVRVRESASDIEFIVDETDQVTRMFRQVTTQLQEGLTRSRMVPFAQTADRLPRAVRDIALKCGKQAELIIEGRDTLIDKMILEHLYDPMTHLVNNALTHGIEDPDVRRSAGKPPTGRISIRAFHQGNQTVISVSDDGAGVDIDRVRSKAIEKGLVTAAEAKNLSRLDIYDLLFHPGFSTKDQADDFAGRGVGMDVVRTSLNEIRGAISTDSVAGKGTTFTIRLPLTLSISKALCCISDRARIAFPMDGVEDMLDLPKERIQTNEGQSCISWRDTVLPLRPLKELLSYNRHLSRGNVYGGNQEDDMVSVVVLRSAGNYLALQVDQVLGEQEIVIKQLEAPIPKPLGVAGATVLGDGRIMPIADVLELIDLSMGRIRHEAGAMWEPGTAQPLSEPVVVKTEPMVLIVDDSITVRELLSMTFNKVGYRVEQARDGQEAWEKLRSGLPCDIVFCDIEMPRMDGLELLSRIQKDPNLNQLPIAMLTSRGADRHRQMASSLGASGYFTKPYLEEALLDAAQRMLKGEVLISSGSAGNS